MTIFSKNLGGMASWAPLATPILWPSSEIFYVRHWMQLSNFRRKLLAVWKITLWIT